MKGNWAIIAAGLTLIALAFIVAALIQVLVDVGTAKILAETEAKIQRAAIMFETDVRPDDFVGQRNQMEDLRQIA